MPWTPVNGRKLKTQGRPSNSVLSDSSLPCVYDVQFKNDSNFGSIPDEILSCISFWNFRWVLDWFHKLFDNLNLTLLIAEEYWRIINWYIGISKSHPISNTKALKYNVKIVIFHEISWEPSKFADFRIESSMF